MASKSWTFRVQHDPEYVGTMCVAGDCDSLGNWAPNELLRLKLDKLVSYTLIFQQKNHFFTTLHHFTDLQILG